ncbi:MAG: glucuronate isomerase [Christensenellaceae bacterium]|nr:glucuronate isomerase [Christensenellaceae bacterium]
MSTKFMDKDFLLSNETAKTLFHEYATKQPIVDYHCHIDPRQIYEDKTFEDIAEIWLGGDHYKWRVMRNNGVQEKYITGDASPYEKFQKWAETMPKLIGNPLYHWTHLELQRYFDIYETLSPETCDMIWEKANEKLKSLSAREIIKQSNVSVICTTDDPTDDLIWHKKIKEDSQVIFKVLPTFRPDKLLNIENDGFKQYLKELEKVSGKKANNLNSLKEIITDRLDYFVDMGCRISDHALNYVVFNERDDIEDILQKALDGKPLTTEEVEAYKTEMLCFLAGLYFDRDIAMQLHYGVVRNVNKRAFNSLGPDTGYDAIWGSAESGVKLGALLSKMNSSGKLPKTIVYSLNPCDNAQIETIIGCFQKSEHPGWMQHGSAWWFNDTKQGMEAQITELANMSVLGNFVGMLTDSRSFLSYTRHEYFRRILCNIIGNWVERGEYPKDIEKLGKMVEDICHNNAISYFKF